MAKVTEIRIQLISDWYGPDGKFRRASQNPHTIPVAMLEELPPSALVEDDKGTFRKQPKAMREHIASRVTDDATEADDDDDDVVETAAEKKARKEAEAAAAKKTPAL